MCYNSVIASIKILLPKSAPSAIIFVVISSNIYAVNSSVFLSMFFAMLFVGYYYIIVKIYKFMPFVTDYYTNSTIVFETIMASVVTPLFHATPYSIQPSIGFAVVHKASLSRKYNNVKQFSTPQLTDLYNQANQ